MVEPLETNTNAPEFTLRDGEGREVNLSDFRGRNVVLAFYPADWSPGCTTELSLMQETLDRIHGYNAEIIAVSCDGPYSHRAWAEQLHLNFPVLSDFWPHGATAREYGVFRENDGMAHRTLFFIDQEGVIRQRWVAPENNPAPGLNVIFSALDEMKGSRQGASHD